jgi:adenylate cyclase
LTGIAAQAGIAIQNARLAKKIEHEAQTRAQLERLVPANVVDQMMTGELTIERGGKLTEVTMLVADIRGFTAMSEKQPPAAIVAMLNEYFEVMVDILFKHGGTLDKFVGDEIIGLFGAPIPVRDAPMRAVVCALEMQKALREFNVTRASENHEAIRVGIGMNTGQVVTGLIGSSKALQYTAIGDAMNTAARLQSIAKAGEIIVSEGTMRYIAERVEANALAPVEVKGKRDRMRVYNVIGVKGEEDWSDSTTT